MIVRTYPAHALPLVILGLPLAANTCRAGLMIKTRVRIPERDANLLLCHHHSATPSILREQAMPRDW